MAMASMIPNIRRGRKMGKVMGEKWTDIVHEHGERRAAGLDYRRPVSDANPIAAD